MLQQFRYMSLDATFILPDFIFFFLTCKRIVKNRIDLELMALIASKRFVTTVFHILHVSQVSQKHDFLVCKVILLYQKILHLLLSLSSQYPTFQLYYPSLQETREKNCFPQKCSCITFAILFINAKFCLFTHSTSF